MTPPRLKNADLEPCIARLLAKNLLEVEETTILMTNPVQSLKFHKVFAAAVLLVLTAVSCLPAADPHSASLVSKTMEVSRTVEASMTVTPSLISSYTPSPTSSYTTSYTPSPTFNPTPTSTPTITFTPSLTPTITRTPSITPTPQPARVTILGPDHVACWFGPSEAYLYKYGLPPEVWMNVIGRNADGTWLLLNDGQHDNPCWIRTEQGKFWGGGDINSHNIPVVDPDAILARAYNLYRPPSGVQAFRSGNKVTVAWNGVWMTEDDYNGYLIEAWVCHNGQLVFTPVKHMLPINQNIEGQTQYALLTDEPGCLLPSSARIYTVEKHGYTLFVKIPWPPYDTASTPTP